ncbi:MAG: hypothetical protein ACW98U_01865 [Candidatus Thorarchaeota archaeon]|jgi:hypothetical protein
MKLFSDEEFEQISQKVAGRTGNFLIAFRNKYGPTRLKQLWTEMMEDLGHPGKCLSWWSGAGTIGLLECESENGLSVYGQWSLDDNHELLNIMEISDDDLVDIRDGFDSGSVTSDAMRAMRIGESGGAKE